MQYPTDGTGSSQGSNVLAVGCGYYINILGFRSYLPFVLKKEEKMEGLRNLLGFLLILGKSACVTSEYSQTLFYVRAKTTRRHSSNSKCWALSKTNWEINVPISIFQGEFSNVDEITFLHALKVLSSL